MVDGDPQSELLLWRDTSHVIRAPSEPKKGRTATAMTYDRTSWKNTNYTYVDTKLSDNIYNEVEGFDDMENMWCWPVGPVRVERTLESSVVVCSK